MVTGPTRALIAENILETGNDSYRFKASSEAAAKITKEATITSPAELMRRKEARWTETWSSKTVTAEECVHMCREMGTLCAGITVQVCATCFVAELLHVLSSRR